ncbi:MAG: DinB family protein [Balneolaceae bacterium]|nr:MAG: DinB family protein [Balneolaceae bacterium]
MKEQVRKASHLYNHERKEFINAVLVLSPRQQQFRSAPDGWNALQIMKHLITAEKQSMLLIHRTVSGKKEIPRAGAGSALRSFILKIALWSPIRFKAPKVAQVSEEAPELTQMVSEWDALFSEIEAFIEVQKDEILAGELYRHPRAGVMNMNQTLGFMQTHIRHHQKQLIRLTCHPEFPEALSET